MFSRLLLLHSRHCIVARRAYEVKQIRFALLLGHYLCLVLCDVVFGLLCLHLESLECVELVWFHMLFGFLLLTKICLLLLLSELGLLLLLLSELGLLLLLLSELRLLLLLAKVRQLLLLSKVWLLTEAWLLLLLLLLLV